MGNAGYAFVMKAIRIPVNRLHHPKRRDLSVAVGLGPALSWCHIRI